MPKSVAEQYPELLHYTTERGLRGILESGCLWASHASHLNDAEELTHFFDARLFHLAFEALLEYGMKVPNSRRKQQVLREGGGLKAVAAADARRITHILRNATIQFHDPYILSLSAPSSDRVAKHGLLSQWRGYGGDGGYALVLETKDLDELLQSEGGQYNYQFAQWGDVYYYGLDSAGQPSSEEVAEYEAVVRHGVLALATGKHPDTVPELYNAITSLSCLFKHWGFAEEQEVRIFAIPASKGVPAEALKSGNPNPPRQPQTFQRGSSFVPYIELFKGLLKNGSRAKLPIKRVLVGPHRQKLQRVLQVEQLLNMQGYSAEVACSEIPYLGH